MKEIEIMAPMEIVVAEMKVMMHRTIVPADPNRSAGLQREPEGWQFVGHVSSEGFRILRRYNPGDRPAAMLMSWHPAANSTTFAPTLVGRMQRSEKGTLLLIEFKRNQSFWMITTLVGTIGSVFLALIIAIGLLQGRFATAELVLMSVFGFVLVLQNFIVGIDKEAEDKQVLLDWLAEIKGRAEKLVKDDSPLGGAATVKS